MDKENLTEKVSVNMNTSTLPEIDLLIDHGYYSNRSDFINQAVRESLSRQRSVIDRIVDSRSRGREESSDTRSIWTVGVCVITAQELTGLKNKGRRCTVTTHCFYILMSLKARCCLCLNQNSVIYLCPFPFK